MENFFDKVLRDGIGTFIFIILIFVIVWLVTRELRCWYSKINKRVQILESIDQRLAGIQQLLAQGNAVNASITGDISNISSGINSNNIAQQKVNNDEDLPEL